MCDEGQLSSPIAALQAGFIYGWRMALIIIAVLPILIVAAYFQTKFMQGASSQVRRAHTALGIDEP